MKKRALSLALVLLMIVSIFPVNFASALIMGDVDGSGDVKAGDARLVLRASVGLETFTEEQLKLADVDFSGDVKAADARLILRASVGLEELKDPHTHSYKASVTKNPTCLDKGIKTFTCDCGDSYTEDIPATGHKAVTDKAVAPTCTKAGKTEGSHCETCGTVIKAQASVPATGHKAVTDKAVAPTCTKAGKTEGSHCGTCGTVIKAQTAVPATGHKKSSLDKSTVVAATCKTDGYSGDMKCDVCKTVTEKGSKIPSTGEEHVLVKKNVAAACTQDGYSVMACKYCDFFDQNTVVPGEKATGHKFGSVTTVKPTCTEQGYDIQICSKCNIDIKSNYVSENGHTYKWTSTKKATCKETGTRTGVCTVCNAPATEVLPLTACVADEKTTIIGNATTLCKIVIKCKTCERIMFEREATRTEHRVMALTNATTVTCTEPSVQSVKCRNCYYTEENKIIQQAPGHSAPYNEALSYEATCTTDGKYVYSGTCTRAGCGEVLDNEEVIIKAKGHDLTGMRTCTTDVTCKTCKQVIEERLGHDFSLNSAAYTAKIDTFFCNRCGVQTDDALKVFNNTANRIKSTAFINYSGSTVINFAKSNIKTEYSRFDFGIYTSAIKSLYEEEMTGNPDSFTPIYTNRTIRYFFPISTYTVSELTNADIDGNVTVEKLSSVSFRDILSEYPDTYNVGTKNYDLNQYKNKTVNEDVIKVTIDIKNEKYSSVKNLKETEKTSLMKVINLDMRNEANEFKNENGDLVMTESEKGDGYEITMRMQLREITTDAKVTYYFLADTYEPIIALYDTYEVMDQTIDMSFKFGLFSLNGELDPIVSTHEKEAYIFPRLFTAA